MKYASDFRFIARNALRGKWAIAVIIGVIVSMLGGISAEGPELNINYENNRLDMGIGYGDHVLYSQSNGFLPGGRDSFANRLVTAGIAYLVIAAIVAGVLWFVLGSVINAGYCKFNLDLIDKGEAEFAPVFSYFPYWKNAASVRFLESVYIFLMTLLLVIPGIITSFNYAVTGYVLAENPHLTATQVLERSKALMYGNRWRFFCLELSFIGWEILCVFTLGIGNLFLTPYKQAAYAAFYRDIAGENYVYVE